MMSRLAVMSLAWAAFVGQLPADEIVTIAGSGKAEFSGDGGPALKAGCNQTFGLEIGPDGALYWCELENHIVRRLDLKSGFISTIAGTGGVKGYSGDDGPATKATMNAPHELRFDSAGHLIVADSFNNVIRRIDGKTGVITTIAGTGEAAFSGDGGSAVKAQINNAISVVLDRQQNLLICDIGNHRIRKVDRKTGLISTWAGTGEKQPTPDGGPLAGSPLFGPRTLAVAENGDVVIVLREGHAVYRYVDKTKTLHHVAGTGTGGYTGDGGDAKLAQVNGPKGVAIAPNGDIYLADTQNHAIRVISAKTGKISSLVGNGQPGDGPDGDLAKCQLHHCHGVYVAKDGTVYIGDSGNHKVRKLTK
jgi:streptogramin lyase